MKSLWKERLLRQPLYKLYIPTTAYSTCCKPSAGLYVADIWVWRERTAIALREQSAFTLQSLKSCKTDIKRQTMFPAKLRRHDKRLSHWNV